MGRDRLAMMGVGRSLDVCASTDTGIIAVCAGKRVTRFGCNHAPTGFEQGSSAAIGLMAPSESVMHTMNIPLRTPTKFPYII